MTLDHPCAACTNGLHVQCTGVCGCLADHPSDDDTMRGFKRLKRQMHPEREAWVRGGWAPPPRPPIRVQAHVGKRIEDKR